MRDQLRAVRPALITSIRPRSRVAAASVAGRDAETRDDDDAAARDDFIDAYLAPNMRRCAGMSAATGSRAWARNCSRRSRAAISPSSACRCCRCSPPARARACCALMGVPYAEVIGDPIAQSNRRLIHKFWLRASSGIEADYRATPGDGGRAPGLFRGAPRRSGLARLQRHHAAQAGDPCCSTGLRSGGPSRSARSTRSSDAKVAWSAPTPMSTGFSSRFRTDFTIGDRLRIVGTGGAARAAFVAAGNGSGHRSCQATDPDKAKARAMLDGRANPRRRISIEPADFRGRPARQCEPAGMGGQPPLAVRPQPCRRPPARLRYRLCTRSRRSCWCSAAKRVCEPSMA